MIPKTWLFTTAVVAVGAALAAIGGVIWRGQGTHCAMDGAILSPSSSVVVEMESSLALEFCSLACAESYLNTSHLKPWRILLVDESTGRNTGNSAGKRIDAADAYFARSQVTASGSRGERRHVFARLDDATAHADAFRGRLLVGDEAPFAAYRAEQKAMRRPRGPLKHHASEKAIEASNDAQEDSPLP